MAKQASKPVAADHDDLTCISCGLGKIETIHVFPVTEYGGLHADGTEYTEIHRKRQRCSHCKQTRITKEFK